MLFVQTIFVQGVKCPSLHLHRTYQDVFVRDISVYDTRYFGKEEGRSETQCELKKNPVSSYDVRK